MGGYRHTSRGSAGSTRGTGPASFRSCVEQALQKRGDFARSGEFSLETSGRGVKTNRPAPGDNCETRITADAGPLLRSKRDRGSLLLRPWQRGLRKRFRLGIRVRIRVRIGHGIRVGFRRRSRLLIRVQGSRRRRLLVAGREQGKEKDEGGHGVSRDRCPSPRAKSAGDQDPTVSAA